MEEDEAQDSEWQIKGPGLYSDDKGSGRPEAEGDMLRSAFRNIIQLVT